MNSEKQETPDNPSTGRISTIQDSSRKILKTPESDQQLSQSDIAVHIDKPQELKADPPRKKSSTFKRINKAI